MKRINHLIEPIADMDNLRLAFWKARKGKSYSQEVEAYRLKLDENLLDLREQLLTGVVKVGNYRYFKIFEPKERQICASAFSEQVMHHALMNICHPYFDRHLIYDSYASRKGKGTYAAIERAKDYTYHYRYFLKLDVRKFFESIHHDVLKTQLSRMFKDTRLLNILNQIINSYEAHPKRGLPIGNLTSQYFANHYLSSLDHYIKETLHIQAYVRYMDDMVLWHDDKSILNQAFTTIKNYISTVLQSDLKPLLLNASTRGLPFLGYRMTRNRTKLLQASKQRFIYKTNYVETQYHTENWSESNSQSHFLPLFAFIQHAETQSFNQIFYLRKRAIIERV